MPGPEKRLPGQSNAEYERRHDPNSDFIGTQSLYGGGDQSWVQRLLMTLSARRDRRKRQRDR